MTEPVNNNTHDHHVAKVENTEVTKQNLSKLLKELSTLLSWSYHKQAEADRAIAKESRQDVKKSVKNVQGTFNSKKVTLFTLATGGLNVLGGITGYSSLKSSNELLKNAPKLLELTSNGTGSVSKLAEGSDQSSRTGAQATLETSKDKLRDAKESSSRGEQKRDQLKQQLQQVMERLHQTIQEMMRR